MNRLQYIALFLAGLMLTGCVSYVPVGPIGLRVTPLENTVPVGAMVKDVQVTDPRIDEAQRRNIGSQLTAQIATHIERGEYFQKVIVFPAKLGEKDVELTFNFSALKGKRAPHPAYFPGALLTLTLWIWVNGPVYVDTYDLAGELRVNDSHGKQLALSRKEYKREINTGFWDRDYINFTPGADQLTDLVESLLVDATQQLPH